MNNIKEKFGDFDKIEKKLGSIEKIDYSMFLPESRIKQSNEQKNITYSIIITNKMQKMELENKNFWPNNMSVEGNKKHRIVSVSSLDKEEVEDWFAKFGCLVDEI